MVFQHLQPFPNSSPGSSPLVPIPGIHQDPKCLILSNLQLPETPADCNSAQQLSTQKRGRGLVEQQHSNSQDVHGNSNPGDGTAPPPGEQGSAPGVAPAEKEKKNPWDFFLGFRLPTDKSIHGELQEGLLTGSGAKVRTEHPRWPAAAPPGALGVLPSGSREQNPRGTS